MPASLIVINDIAAYICGFFIGRTPLIKLSPKKTWEGFFGALIVTVISASLVRVISENFIFPLLVQKVYVSICGHVAACKLNGKVFVVNMSSKGTKQLEIYTGLLCSLSLQEIFCQKVVLVFDQFIKCASCLL